MKRGQIALGVSLAAMIGLIAWRIWGSWEPSYKGKPLTYWLSLHSSKGAAPSRRESELAIRNIGTNAIPILLGDLQFHQEEPTRMTLLHLAQKIGFLRARFFSRYGRGDEAVAAFALLGSDGAPAVRSLIHILDRDPALEVRCRVLIVLGSIGPQAAPAVPALLRALNDSTNSLVRINASAALERIHADPSEVVPALVKCLHDSDSFVRINAIRGLGKFGSHGEPAVLELLKIVRNRKLDSSRDRGFLPIKDDPAGFMLVPMFIPKPGDDAKSAAAALWAIDPGAATNAGVGHLR